MAGQVEYFFIRESPDVILALVKAFAEDTAQVEKIGETVEVVENETKYKAKVVLEQS